ncbi:GNAT family N-acetyltransferase [Microbacteriaceae bacterium 4G12]
MMETFVQEVLSKEDFQVAWSVMQELRTHLSEEEYMTLLETMKGEGYRMFGLYNEEGEPLALAGVAIVTNFYNGRHVFVYDLVTAERYRSQGCGAKLLSYMEQWGKEHGCENLALTSGFQRQDAHRFYEREGYEKRSFAFCKAL